MNRNYSFGKGSMRNIVTLSAPLQRICHEGLRIANSRKVYCPDFSIVRGLTSAENQFELWKKGREPVEFMLPDDDEFKDRSNWRKVGKTVTNCDGYEVESDHQKADIDGGSFAFDFACWINGGSNYEDQNMALVATCFFEAASNDGFVIDWGGNYRSISDGSHISLVV